LKISRPPGLLGDEKSIDLLEEEFFLFRDLMYEQSGVLLDEKSKYFLENRLIHSVRRLQLKKFIDYYYYLKYDREKDEELSNMVDLLTIHETYFFREEQQLKSFSEEVLLDIYNNGKNHKTLRIWSAGCSTGEEPYTLAMILLEKKEFRNWKIEIFATDISQRVIQSARKGLYQESSFRATDGMIIDRYFNKEGNQYRISDRVKKNVIFVHFNLVETTKLHMINLMDLIFCRNVIIYFYRHARKTVVGIFHEKLKDNGYLFLGHSESLINISTSFALRHLKHDMVYQKLAREPISLAHTDKDGI